MGRASKKSRKQKKRTRYVRKMEERYGGLPAWDTPMRFPRLAGAELDGEDAGWLDDDNLGDDSDNDGFDDVPDNDDALSPDSIAEMLIDPDLRPQFARAAARMQRLANGQLSDEEWKDYQDIAQDLAFDAIETEDPKESLELALEALTYDPGCVDAFAQLAQLTSRNGGELIEKLEMTVQIAADRLGAAFFDKHRGYFWELAETRPYMRARLQLVLSLIEADRSPEAIAHMEEMLELNPDDDLEMRINLLCCYLQENRLDKARQLFDRFQDDRSAYFRWARVLERFLTNDLTGAERALSDARMSNLHVEKFLTGTGRLPEYSPRSHPRDKSEAIAFMEEVGPAWQRHPAAIEWLKARA